jgi:hypothetical protein
LEKVLRLQGASLHVQKSLIFVYEGDFGVNISLIRSNKVRGCSIWLGLFPNREGGASQQREVCSRVSGATSALIFEHRPYHAGGGSCFLHSIARVFC